MAGERKSGREGKEPMILLIDNYDSFTYNVVHYFGELGAEIVVKRNDELTLEEIDQLAPSHLVISPGPSTPKEAGISLNAIRHFSGKIPIFGICLGHQAIAEAFGGEVIRASKLMHGKTSIIDHDESGIFQDVKRSFTAARYHSLIVKRETLPDCLEITAWTEAGEIMGIRHRELAIEGVQFHPESILTAHGKQLLKNFLAYSGGTKQTT